MELTGTVNPNSHACPRLPRGRLARALHKAMKSRFAYPALLLGVLLESTIFPWPVEFMIAAMMLEHRRNVLPVTLITVGASIAGAALFFFLGAYFYETVGADLAQTMGWGAAVEEKRQVFQTHGFWILVLAAQTPLPYQASALAAGLAGVVFWPFLLAAVIGKGVRYGLMGLALYFFGPALRSWWRTRPRLIRRAVLGALVGIFVLSLILPFLL